jgi:hypothetical protein
VLRIDGCGSERLVTVVVVGATRGLCELMQEALECAVARGALAGTTPCDTSMDDAG